MEAEQHGPSLHSVLASLFPPADKGSLPAAWMSGGWKPPQIFFSLYINLKHLCVGPLCVLWLVCCCHFLSRSWCARHGWDPEAPSTVGPRVSKQLLLLGACMLRRCEGMCKEWVGSPAFQLASGLSSPVEHALTHPGHYSR